MLERTRESRLNPLDRAIAWFAPAAALRRVQARRVLAAYDAGTPSRLRRFSRERRSGEAMAKAYAPTIRDQARELDRNHDLARGAITVLVNNIVGANGIGIEPQPRTKDGDLHNDLASSLLELWRDWSRWPEVTYQHDWAAVQRLACRTWLRDGEVFAQILQGSVNALDHRTRVPLSLELIEPDLVPSDGWQRGIERSGGIQVNAWGQPTVYYVLKAHPGDTDSWHAAQEVKPIPAEFMIHLRHVDRIRQLRGVSVFAAVITRLEDLREYEESERLAAKIAASMAGYIRKGQGTEYVAPEISDDGEEKRRELRFEAGMIFDDLLPGEEIGTIDTSRPNTNLQAFRDGQLRAVAAGMGAAYSSVARAYDGNYSAQRQELVEQWVHYQVMADLFTAQFVLPVWERFVAMAKLSGALRVPKDVDLRTLDDALMLMQQMPWIDPLKEASANKALEEAGYKSAPEIIRSRGANPREVLQQQANWLRQKREAGLVDAPAAPAAPAGNPAQSDPPDSSDPDNDAADDAKDDPSTDTKSEKP